MFLAMLLHNCYKLDIEVSFILSIQHSYLLAACFNFQVDVRPTLEMLRNAGIKVTRLLYSHYISAATSALQTIRLSNPGS